MAGIGLGLMSEGLTEGSKPAAIALGDLLAHKNIDRKFITVRGVVVPGAGFQYVETKKKSGTSEVKHAYVPLVDPQTKQGILIQVGKDEFQAGEPSEIVVTGMLKPVGVPLKEQLDRTDGKLSGLLPVDRLHVIHKDEKPTDPAVAAGSATIFGFAFLALLGTTFMRYTIFRPQSDGSAFRPITRTITGSDGEKGNAFRATGRFSLAGHAPRRFINVPAGVGHLDSGEIAILANVDASSRFMGFKTADRSGIWGITIPSGSILKRERGDLYFGFRSWPAVRLVFKVGGLGNRTQSVIVSAMDLAGQDEIWQRLLQESLPDRLS